VDDIHEVERKVVHVPVKPDAAKPDSHKWVFGKGFGTKQSLRLMELRPAAAEA
jgi:hypothetical protein